MLSEGPKLPLIRSADLETVRLSLTSSLSFVRVTTRLIFSMHSAIISNGSMPSRLVPRTPFIRDTRS